MHSRQSLSLSLLIYTRLDETLEFHKVDWGVFPEDEDVRGGVGGFVKIHEKLTATTQYRNQLS